MKTAIITGVGGFIGSHLCNRLLNDGVKVYGVDVTAAAHERFRHPCYVPITASFTDYYSLHELINEPIDVFFHLAFLQYQTFV